MLSYETVWYYIIRYHLKILKFMISLKTWSSGGINKIVDCLSSLRYSIFLNDINSKSFFSLSIWKHWKFYFSLASDYFPYWIPTPARRSIDASSRASWLNFANLWNKSQPNIYSCAHSNQSICSTIRCEISRFCPRERALGDGDCQSLKSLGTMSCESYT